MPKDVRKAVSLFMESAEQKNEYAAYQLGKLYLAGEDIPKDVDTAIRWLTEAADQNNQYAQYLLGKLYLCGRDVPRDREKAILFLQASAHREISTPSFSSTIWTRFVTRLLFWQPPVCCTGWRICSGRTIRKQLAAVHSTSTGSAGVSWRRRNRRRDTNGMTENPFNRLFDRRCIMSGYVYLQTIRNSGPTRLIWRIFLCVRESGFCVPAGRSVWTATTASRCGGMNGMIMPPGRAVLPLTLCRCSMAEASRMQLPCC